MKFFRLLCITLFLAIFVFTNSPYCIAAEKPLELVGIGTLSLPDNINVKRAQPDDSSSKLDIQYDLTSRTGDDIWHYARLIAFDTKQDIGLTGLLFNNQFKNPQLVEMLSEFARQMLKQQIQENGGTLLKWNSFKPAKIGKYSGFNMSFHCIATNKLPMPLYVSVYFFTPDQSLAGIALMSADSDRKYWELMFRDSVANIL